LLVIDRSESMLTGDKLEQAKQAARYFVSLIEFTRDRVGLIAFDERPELAVPLTNDALILDAAIAILQPAGSTNLGRAVAAAQQELSGPRRRQSARAILILITDGVSDPRPAVSEAGRAKAAGTRLFTIGWGYDTDRNLLRRMASTPADAYFEPRPGELSSIYADIAARIAAKALVQAAVVTDTLPTNMAYLGPASTPGPEISGQDLVWQISDQMSGFTFSYNALPLVDGLLPTNEQAVVRLTDGLGRVHSLLFPVPYVRVIAIPTPTSTETVTPSPSVTPSSTPTPSPTVTSTLTRQPTSLAHLPIALVRHCTARRDPLDVVLALDASNSMNGAKIEQALAASRLFITELDFSLDRVAVVHFNRTATVVQSLTDDPILLQRALANVSLDFHTRIDLALLASADELRAHGRRGVDSVVVLLTDGQHTDTRETALAAAANVRARSVRVVTIALGEDADYELLRQVATQPRDFYVAEQATDLSVVLRAIGAALPCDR
jgi:Mg-chelatase subunit ChlD